MRTFSAAFVSLLAILPLVLSTPIPAWSSTVVDKPAAPDDADSKARVAALHEADGRAKEMVDNMVTVANSNKPEHKKIVNDAFGPNADRKKIKETIHKLNTEQVKIASTDVAAGMKPGLVATTPMNRPEGPGKPIKLGAPFFDSDASKDFRAGTLIHEATHQQSYTGDAVGTDNKMVGALKSQKENIKMVDGKVLNGYHYPGAENPKKVPTSAADLSEKYKNNRDNVVQDMHANADSYRVFAHLCSQPGVARRDIELFSRALLEADADDHFYLAKRSSCALPKDYFKNKAAAKAAAPGKGTKAAVPGKGTKAAASGKGTKAAVPGKGTKSVKSTSGLTKGAATKGAQGRTVSKAGGKPSAVKDPKGAGKRVSRVTSPGRTSQKGASGAKSLASNKSTKPNSRVAKGVTQGKGKQVAQKKGGSGVKSHASTKSTKPNSRVAKGVAQGKVNHVAQKKGGSGVKSQASTKSTKPISRVAKGVTQGKVKQVAQKKVGSGVKSQASTKSTKPISRVAKGVTQPKVNHVAQKKAAPPVPKKSTPQAAPPKKAAAPVPKKLTPQAAPPKKAGKK